MRREKVMLVIKVSGKAHQVFRYLALLAEHRGKETLGQIMESAKKEAKDGS